MHPFAEEVEKGQLERAICGQAMKSDPENAQLLAEYASKLADLNRPDDALQNVQKALERDPDNVDAHLLKGDIYFRVRMPQDQWAP